MASLCLVPIPAGHRPLDAPVVAAVDVGEDPVLVGEGTELGLGRGRLRRILLLGRERRRAQELRRRRSGARCQYVEKFTNISDGTMVQVTYLGQP